MNKTSTDLIVKLDNRSLHAPSQSTFSNGGNLEELLHDIENISQDILKLSTGNLNDEKRLYQNGDYASSQEIRNEPNYYANVYDSCDDKSSHLKYSCECCPSINSRSGINSSVVPTGSFINNCDQCKPNMEVLPEKPYKSELSVVLMPTPMPLIGFDKYRNVQRSCESFATNSFENLSATEPNSAFTEGLGAGGAPIVENYGE